MKPLNLLLSLVLAASFGASTAWAQIASQLKIEKTEKCYVIVTEEGYQATDGLWIVPETSSPKMAPAAIITLSAMEGYMVQIEAESAERDIIATKKLSDGRFIITGAPKAFVRVDAIRFDPENPANNVWLKERFVVVVEDKPEPEPEPEPEPDPETDDEDDDDFVPDEEVPSDEFDDIGRRVNHWATGLGGRKIIAGCYKKAVDSLNADPSKTIDQVGQSLLEAIQATPDYTDYKPLLQKVNDDLSKRLPLNRFVLARYFGAIASGLGSGQ